MSCCPEAQRLADEITSWLSEVEDYYGRDHGFSYGYEEDATTHTVVIREIIEDAGYVASEAERRQKALAEMQDLHKAGPVRRLLRFVKRHPL